MYKMMQVGTQKPRYFTVSLHYWY